ncbi:MerR family transcriptional regulator [Pseudoflavonifractor sp. 60]|uniref:MerR family transcriptional regulator n=1 Tax=Pseudoflavonifractor sp. 60 TaxID=2304576 RepID=UPI00136D4AAF|nr:MerR family transcriptional regulator [Pseudoflavonifractor sp. 60]NBI65428.1 MerR family transcriptional regulator [Pseudoflavonifractor sp. 60]
MFYTIGEMAQKLNVAPSTLRYYDKEGLLPFVERSSGGSRMFKDEDMEWLKLLGCLKKAGMPLKEIRDFMEYSRQGDATIDRRLEIIEHQRQSVLEQQRQLEETLLMLDYKRWYYQTAQEAGTCAVHDSLTPEQIPESFRALKEEWQREQ